MPALAFSTEGITRFTGLKRGNFCHPTIVFIIFGGNQCTLALRGPSSGKGTCNFRFSCFHTKRFADRPS
jgi:hypothetical protein